MIEALLLALFCAKLRGYKIMPIFKSWHIYPTLLLSVVYIFLQASIFIGNYSYIKYAKGFETIYICTLLLIIIKYKQYIAAISGSICIFVGSFLNQTAIRANNGKMPVFPSLSYLTGYASADSFERVNDIHILGSSATKLKPLTDIIDLGYSVMSIGDVLIRIFTFVVIFYAITFINNKLRYDF